MPFDRRLTSKDYSRIIRRLPRDALRMFSPERRQSGRYAGHRRWRVTFDYSGGSVELSDVDISHLPACYYARAQVIQNIITTVEAAATSPTATLSSLQASIAQAVATAPVQDQAALNLLLNQLVIALNASVGPNSGTGVLGSLQQATITTVGGWITAVTSGYKAPAA